ncbi:MAG: chemotaxis protein CheW [Oligoflexia bacterium]|nr:chemotaxis protein CheW [Oligoflexia bacterium]
MDKNKIIKKALEKKLISSSKTLQDQDIFDLIFLPGFSTAEKVTDISGRGVGMDVVRKNIDELHGMVDTESKLNEGTLFRIRIPNTMAIIEGMVVIVGGERYVIPTQSVIKASSPKSDHVIKSTKTLKEMIDLDGELLQLFRLAAFYNVKGAITRPTDSIILVLEENHKRFGLMVDQILKQQQFVVKGLGKTLGAVPGVSGGTIMSDGSVGIILDVGLLIQSLLYSQKGREEVL